MKMNQRVAAMALALPLMVFGMAACGEKSNEDKVEDAADDAGDAVDDAADSAKDAVDGATDAASGVRLALQQLKRRGASKNRRHIVMFSDGDLMATGRDAWVEAAGQVADRDATLDEGGVEPATKETLGRDTDTPRRDVLRDPLVLDPDVRNCDSAVVRRRSRSFTLPARRLATAS